MKKIRIDSIEMVTIGDQHEVLITGWADPGRFSPDRYHVYMGATFLGSLAIEARRPDVHRIYPQIPEMCGIAASLRIEVPFADHDRVKILDARTNRIIRQMRVKRVKRLLDRPSLFSIFSMAKVRKAWLLLKTQGMKAFLRELHDYFNRHAPAIDYADWVQINRKTASEKAKERRTVFAQNPLISLVVPVYNTPGPYLKDMIRSVTSQTYARWELILVNGGSTDPAIVPAIQAFSIEDPRIRLIDLKENLGISGNTNQGFEAARGEFIGLLDHDDVLDASALFEVVKALNQQPADLIYSDEDKFINDLSDRFSPHFKPDFNRELLHGYNYICHFAVVRTTLLRQAGGERPECDGAQDYDLFLHLVDLGARVVHIPRILYHWRSHELSTAKSLETKTYVVDATLKALADHAARIGRDAMVGTGLVAGVYHVRYQLRAVDKVSIVIPNRNEKETLARCIESILTKTAYPGYEILIVENNSTDPEIFAYYEQVVSDPRVKVLHYPHAFNYSAVNNWACRQADGAYYLLMNNDMSVINPDWLGRMVEYAQFPENGAVGAKLYFPDDTIQHGGVILGLGGVAGHSHKYFLRSAPGYMARLMVVQNLSAVTAACMLVRADAYQAVGGLDEGYAIAFNDIDFCMKLGQAGYQIVWTPYAELYHYESLSRGAEDTPEKVARFTREGDRFKSKWGERLNDPHYNVNLTLDREDFSLSTKGNRR